MALSSMSFPHGKSHRFSQSAFLMVISHQQSALQPAPLPCPTFFSSWQPAACSSQPQARIFSTSRTSRSQVLPHSWQPEAFFPPTPKNLDLGQPYYLIPNNAFLLVANSLFLLSTFKQILQKLYKQSPTPSCVLVAGSLPSLPPPSYFPPCLTTLYGPTDWKAAAWNLEGGNVHRVIYAPGPADAVTQVWRIAQPPSRVTEYKPILGQQQRERDAA